MLSTNPFTPFVLNQLKFNETDADIIGLDKSHIGSHAGSYLKSVAFLHLNVDPKSDLFYRSAIYECAQNDILKILNPAYVFQHEDNPGNIFYYHKYYTGCGTAALILFNYRLPKSLHIPCLACLSSPPTMVEITSLSELTSLWTTLNNNLHQKFVEIDGFYLSDDHQCETGIVKLQLNLLYYYNHLYFSFIRV